MKYFTFYPKLFLMMLVIFLGLGRAQAGEISLGVQYDNYTTNYTAANVGGSELMIPFSAYYNVDHNWGIYGQALFVNGNYTDGSTLNLSDLSDSVVGSDLHFASFGLLSVVNVALNLPTGNQTWEEQQAAFNNIPTEFIDTRYRGRGFGASAFYGLSAQDGKTTQLGAGLGYLFSGAFNQFEGSAGVTLGDSVFLALNRVEAFAGNKTSTFRLEGMAFLPTQTSGKTVFQMGPNFDASYNFTDPSGFSYEIGGQFFTPAGRPATLGGPVITEPHNTFAPRLYVAPSLAFGNLIVSGIVKYIFPNDYSGSNSYYDGGGVLVGLNPVLTAPLDSVSSLKFNAGYDFVIHHNAYGEPADPADVDYSFWSVGTNYEIKI